MKKLALAIALTGFIGTYSIANSIEPLKIEVDGDCDGKGCKDKNCKKCKDSKKTCTKNDTKKSCTKTKAANTKTCNKTAKKSCCAHSKK